MKSALKVVDGGKEAPRSGFRVERGIAIPPRSYSPRASRFPWDNMGVGDSFFIACDDPRKAGAKGSSAAASGRRWAKATGHPNMDFTSRRVEGGARVWRFK